MTTVRVPDVKAFIAGHGHLAMPPSLASLTTSWAAPEAGTRRDGLRIALIAALYVAFGLAHREVRYPPPEA